MKLKRTVVAIVLCICTVVTCLPMLTSAENVPEGKWTDYAAGSFAGGSGTKEDPYKIATAEQLALLAKQVNAGGNDSHAKEYFILTSDIDLSDHVWTPLGYESYSSGGGSAQSFQGYFDGNGKKITGLYVDEREGDSWGKNRNSGLFGVITATGTEPVIRNLTVENATVLAGDGDTNSGDDYGAGVLVGSITVLGNNVEYALIENCTVSGTVNSTKNAGGLVGDASYTHFENCSADVKVEGYSVSGGFVANTFISEFIDCTARGNVTSQGWSTGGFAGVLYCKTTVTHCAAFGNVEANNWNLGGFAGFAEDNTTISNSIAMGNVKSNVTSYSPKAGGFLGTAWDDTVKLEKCHAAGSIATARDDKTVGGVVGAYNGSVTGCSFDSEKNPSLEGKEGAAAQNTAGVKANICVDYYGGHKDENSNHICDMCNTVFTNHADENDDHLCDICGKAISNHTDENKDHVCDICNKIYTNHADENKDHVCDICSKVISNHADENSDHVCDICNKAVTNHADEDKDHVCDICDKVISNHADENGDHVCDICDKIYTNHADENKDHVCDICSKVISNHADENKDHVCDICNKVISNHADENKDHVCDICGKAVSNHTGGTATCKEKAVCEICGEAYGELDANNHKELTHVEAKEATKEEEGNTEYWYCKDCGKYYSDKDGEKEIAKADTVIPKVPQTGDESSNMLLFALLFLSAGALAAVVLSAKKKDRVK